MTYLQMLEAKLQDKGKFIIPYLSKRDAELAYSSAVKKMRHVSDFLVAIRNYGIEFCAPKTVENSIKQLFLSLR